jgi:uncharacterized protein (TIGR00255 family)
MTGHGEAQCHQDGLTVAVEVRTVNNRFVKVAVRIPDAYHALEPEIEVAVRQHVRRGSVAVTVQVQREVTADDYKLNEAVLASYRRQLDRVCQQAGLSEAVRLDALLGLPGVVTESGASRHDAEADWPFVEQTLTAALQNLARMRTAEGAVMARDLHAQCDAISAALDEICQRAPVVVEAYRQRLTDRLNALLQEYGVSIQPADIIREVGIFADRSDISEESVRLRSHLQQFDAIAQGEESSGRKLEFVIQEMLRETNTLGSKANDAEIARHVVEIKTAIERMREMIQNVE